MSVTVTTHNGGTYEFTKADDFAVNVDLPGVQILKDGKAFAVVRNFETVVIEDGESVNEEPSGPEIDPVAIAESRVAELKAELANWEETLSSRYKLDQLKRDLLSGK